MPETDALEKQRALQRACTATTIWVVIFIVLHIYWFFGGKLGFGDQKKTIPGIHSVGDVVFTAVITGMFAAGAVLPSAFIRPWGRRIPRVFLLTSAWFGAAILLARGGAGLIDTSVRELGLAPRGITGLTYEEVTGGSDPTAYTLWSGSAIDAYFLLGGMFFTVLARRAIKAARARRQVAAGTNRATSS